MATDLAQLQEALNRKAALQRAVLEAAAQRRAFMSTGLTAGGRVGTTQPVIGNVEASNEGVQFTPAERDVLVRTVLGEAAGEGKQGMAAVAWVIRNRAESGEFPSNPAEVALQKNKKGVHQFSTWNNEKLGGNSPQKYVPGTPEWNEALAAITGVFGGAIPDPTGGAQFYYANAGLNAIDTPKWFDKNATAGATQIGHHVFASTKAAQAGMAPQPFQMPSSVAAGRVSASGRVIPGQSVRDAAHIANGVRNPAITAGTKVSGAALAASLIAHPVQTVPIDPETGQPITQQAQQIRSATNLAGGALPQAPGENRSLPTTSLKQQLQEGLKIAQPAVTPPKPATVRESIQDTRADQQVAAQRSAPGAQQAVTTYVDTNGGEHAVINPFVPVPAGGRPSSVESFTDPRMSQIGSSGLEAALRASSGQAAQPTTKLVVQTVKIRNPNYVAPVVTKNVSGSPDDRDNRSAGVVFGADLARGALPAQLKPVEPEWIEKKITRQVTVQPRTTIKNPQVRVSAVAAQVNRVIAAQKASLYTAASEAAYNAGKKTYETNPAGMLQSTVTITGQKRNTYGDSSFNFSGANGFGNQFGH